MELVKVKEWNCYVHLPDSYAGNHTRHYPTLLFSPGLGEIGNDAQKVIANGPGAYLTQGWNGTAMGIEFIILCLQPPTAWPGSSSVKVRVDELRKLYRISDLWMTGLSMGGNVSLEYSYTYPDEIKGVVGVESVVPSAGSGTDYAERIHTTYRIPAEAGQKYLLFEQKNDWRRNDQVVDAMNYWRPGSAIYEYTAFGGGGHCCWNEFYGGNGKEPGRFNIGGNALTLYEWLAGAFVLPNFITKAAKRGNELSWHCENTEEGDYFLIEKTTDFIKFETVERIPATGNDFKLKV